MTSAKPTIILIPEKWFNRSAYDSFLTHLKSSSSPTTYGPYSEGYS